MDISFTDEQLMLQDALVRYLKNDYDFDTRRKRLADTALDGALWEDFASTLGILGANFPEEVGGLGGGPVEVMIIQEALGSALVIEPYLETVVIGGGLLRRSVSDDAAELLGGIAEGTVRIAFAASEREVRHAYRFITTTAARTADGWELNGAKTVVVGAPSASHWIVLARTSGEHGEDAGLSLFLVDPQTPGIERHDYRLIDERPASDLTFRSVKLSAAALISGEGDAIHTVEAVTDEGIAALCAEAVGIVRRMLADTVEYTKQRKQFGQPISSFQVLQHRMVDMYMHVEEAAAAALLAALNLSADAETRGLAVSAAKATIARCCRFVGQNAVQLHGAIGMMDELAVSHFFKRSTAIENQFGSEDHHKARYAKLSRSRAAA